MVHVLGQHDLAGTSSQTTPRPRAYNALDATIYPALAGGCHCARDTGASIRQAGFTIDREERIAFKPSPVIPSIPHILGAARMSRSTDAKP
jgi:hypothetical protein